MIDTGAAPAIGVIFHPSFPPETLADYARRAEAAGFDELWLWDDCFQPGALTSAAIALAATRELKVGIGLMPATVYHPLFAAMEITTLARAFPGRLMPGFGFGAGPWMVQIGAAPKSSIKALSETVTAVRQILQGEKVTLRGEQVKLEGVQMQTTAEAVPELYIGAMREKGLRLAGRLGDGAILTHMSSPAYVRWALEHIRAGMAEAGRTRFRLVVYVDVKVNEDGALARRAARRALAERLPWEDTHLNALGIAEEAAAFARSHSYAEAVEAIPDEWVDAFCAAGTAEQVSARVERWMESGASSVVFQPLNGDPDCLDEYIRLVMPRLQAKRQAAG